MRRIWALAMVAVAAVVVMADSPLTPLGNIRGRTDENGYLRISKGPIASAADSPLTALANVGVRTDDNGYLRVSCSNCDTITTATITTANITTENVTTSNTGVQNFTATLFANLGTPSNGQVVYCSDCTFANPCAGAGTGAIAKRLAGAWRCD